MKFLNGTRKFSKISSGIVLILISLVLVGASVFGLVSDKVNPNGEVVYEANMVKMTLFKPFVFDFVNCTNGRSVTREIGHTVANYAGAGAGGFSFQVPISKSFTVDGVNNWDFLANAGYSFDFSLDGLTPCFDVKHYGVSAAKIRGAGTNVITGKDYAVGNLPANGIYTLECRKSDLDMICMVCFSIARAVFYAN